MPEQDEPTSILGSGFLPDHIGKMGIVNWKDIRDRYVPQGMPVSAKDMVDRPFKILRMRPYPSQFPGSRDTVYWIVALTDDGELTNFTVGGVAACDQLDAIHKLNEDFRDAVKRGNIPLATQMAELGAGKPLRVVLKWNEGGQNEGYYTLE